MEELLKEILVELKKINEYKEKRTADQGGQVQSQLYVKTDWDKVKKILKEETDKAINLGLSNIEDIKLD